MITENFRSCWNRRKALWDGQKLGRKARGQASREDFLEDIETEFEAVSAERGEFIRLNESGVSSRRVFHRGG